jgi:mannose-6-phosphate isomerase-like protein (cupin superfamily)
MAHAGEVIENPTTGETVTFLVTASESEGTLLRLEMTSSQASAPAHQHPRLTERWDLQEGTARVHVGGAEQVLVAPAKLEFPRGTAHDFRTDGPIRVTVDYEPAGGFESFLETIYALARDGKTDAKGMPNLLQSAVIARAHLDDYALANVPVWLQRILFAVLAPIGRLLGYRARYPGQATP